MLAAAGAEIRPSASARAKRPGASSAWDIGGDLLSDGVGGEGLGPKGGRATPAPGLPTPTSGTAVGAGPGYTGGCGVASPDPAPSGAKNASLSEPDPPPLGPGRGAAGGGLSVVTTRNFSKLSGLVAEPSPL